MIDKQMQRNSLGIIGIGALGGCVMQAASGNFETAIVLGAVAPSMFALRADIPSLTLSQDIDDRENAIYQTMEYNERECDTRISDVERHIENEVREIYSEMSNTKG